MGWLEYNSDNFDSDFVEDFYSPEFKFRWNGRKVFTDTFDSDGKDW
jgi:hypothetical protein